MIYHEEHVVWIDGERPGWRKVTATAWIHADELGDTTAMLAVLKRLATEMEDQILEEATP